jgi:catechol 2,3-dioxygenase-like lactoylglutathione lyase family enzyme
MTTEKVEPLDMKLEVVVLGVSDIDRAKAFYEKLGWRGSVAPRRATAASQRSCANEHNHDERRDTDLLQGLGHRAAGGLQPRLAALRRCV